MKKTKLIIVRGVAGSGKSTFAKTLGLPVFETDKFFYKNGIYLFDKLLLGRNHNKCFRAVKKSLEAGKSCVVANTFTTIKEMQRYIDFCNDNGIDIDVYRMTTQYKSIHNVPDNVIELMKERFENYFGEVTV